MSLTFRSHAFFNCTFNFILDFLLFPVIMSDSEGGNVSDASDDPEFIPYTLPSIENVTITDLREVINECHSTIAVEVC